MNRSEASCHRLSFTSVGIILSKYGDDDDIQHSCFWVVETPPPPMISAFTSMLFIDISPRPSYWTVAGLPGNPDNHAVDVRGFCSFKCD